MARPSKELLRRRQRAAKRLDPLAMQAPIRLRMLLIWPILQTILYHYRPHLPSAKRPLEFQPLEIQQKSLVQVDQKIHQCGVFSDMTKSATNQFVLLMDVVQSSVVATQVIIDHICELISRATWSTWRWSRSWRPRRKKRSRAHIFKWRWSK